MVPRNRVLAALGCGVGLFLLGQLVLGSRRAGLHLWVNSAWTLASLAASVKTLNTARKLKAGPRQRAFYALGIGCCL